MEAPQAPVEPVADAGGDVLFPDVETEEGRISRGWIGVDLDGTLAHYEGWQGPEVIGEPVPAMLARVKAWLVEGREVRILTARAADPVSAVAVQEWCRLHLGVPLEVTDRKDYAMVELWDDRCVQVETNTGRRVAEVPHAHTFFTERVG